MPGGGLARHALRHAADPILWAGPDARVIYVNEAAARVYGCDPRAGGEVSLFDLDAALKPATWAEHRAGVQARGVWTYESIHRNAEGRAFPVEVSAAWLEYEGESYYFAVVHDLTERKRHEAELIRARKDAEEMSRLKTDFIAKISHEIRTPLASIIGFATILREETPARHRKFIRFIERSGKRLLETVNAMLSLSMPASGAMKLRHEVIRVGACVAEKAERMRPLVEEKGLTLAIDLPEPDVTALLDREGLGRVLDTLLANAVKFTEAGGIRVRVRDRDRRVEIRVEDTGVGISEDFLLRLFDTFTPENPAPGEPRDGVGPGPALARELVSMMGGDLTVETEKGRGSAFIVSFPRQNPAPRKTTPPAPAGPLTLPEKRGEQLRALVVEDGPEMLVLLRHYLGEGFEVTTRADGRAAFELMQKQTFDLVLMDINLGGAYSGIDLLHEIRRMDRHTPVIAVTAYALPGDRDHLIDAGFEGYVGKPFTKKELHAVIARVLDGQRTRATNAA
ncbi:response regulator [Rhodocaloribacter sp.]